jgi:hypothetical protein
LTPNDQDELTVTGRNSEEAIERAIKEYDVPEREVFLDRSWISVRSETEPPHRYGVPTAGKRQKPRHPAPNGKIGKTLGT